MKTKRAEHTKSHPSKPKGGRFQKRHLARRCTLQMLYSYSVTGGSPEAISSWFWQMKEYEDDPEFKEDAVFDLPTKAFATQLLDIAIHHQTEIDQWIERSAEHWDLPRIALVDKVILRMALAEMIYLRKNIPVKVTINEAIELAKEFSTENSSRFVNGILDRVRRELNA
ncbi:MAG: transcription antitermination factor NusB [Gemmatimonadetes bacterium]|nr:MAG: transcription antitermination factor NusB [Gemmatimonadota bacterium]